MTLRVEESCLVFGCAALLAVGAGCGAASVSAEEGEGAERGTRYHFAVDAALSRLDVELCFEGAPTAELAGGALDSHLFLIRATREDGTALPMNGRRISLRGLPRDACVHYAVDLAEAARSGPRHAERSGRDLLTSSALWLWSPWPRPVIPAGGYAARFDLPRGVRLAAAYPVDAARPSRAGVEHRRLMESAFTRIGYVAFTHTSPIDVEVPGGEIQGWFLDAVAPLELSTGERRRWLSELGRAASLAIGRFPVPRATIIAVPVPAGRDSVPFGIAGRGGGAGAKVYVRHDASTDELLRHWTPVHELSHFLLPYVDPRDAWLSEGLATHYQEVLRARAGHMPAAEIRAAYEDGLARGRASVTDRTLAEESAGMQQTLAFQRVYWGGAAVMLAVDEAIRRETGGQRTLDDVVADVNARAALSPGSFPASEVIRLMDESLGSPIVSRTVEPWLRSSELPPVVLPDPWVP